MERRKEIKIGDQVVVSTKQIPEQLFEQYRSEARRLATTVRLDDGQWFAEISGFAGLWGTGESAKDALVELDEAMREWLLLKIEDGDRDIPVISGLDLNGI